MSLPISSRANEWRVGVVSGAVLLFGHLAIVVLLRDVMPLRMMLGDLLLLTADVLATAGLFWAAHRSAVVGRQMQLAWTAMACAQLSHTLGDGVTAAMQLALLPGAFPSLADGLYLGGYLLWALGLILPPGRKHSAGDWLTTLLDTTIAVFTAILFVSAFFVFPALVAGASSSAALAVSIAYPVVALVLFAALLEMFYRRRGWLRYRPTLLLLVGTAVRLIAGAFSYRIPLRWDTYLTGDLSDTMWLASCAIVGLAGWLQAASPTEPTVSAASDEDDRKQTFSDSVLPYLWVVVVFPLLIWNHFNPLPLPGDLLAWCITSILTLVLIRQMVTGRENARLIDVTRQEIAERRRVEGELRRTHDELDRRVQERTADLARTNAALRAEIDERQKAQEENLKRTAQLEALRETSLELTAQLDVESLLGSISRRAVKLMGATTGSFYLYRPEQDLLERAVVYGPQLVQSVPTRRRGEGLIGKVWETGAPLFINDYDQWTERNPTYDEGPSRAVMGLPIRWGERFLGVVTIVAHHPRTFSPADVDLLKLFADQAAIALENARLYEQAQQEIKERERAQAALRESEERFTLAVRGANDGLWDWDLRTGQVFFSPRWKGMLGRQEDEIGSSPEDWFDRLHPKDVERVRRDIAAHLDGQTPHFESEYRILHKDGAYRWMLCRGLAVRDGSNRAYRLAGSQTDITTRKATEERLLHDALHDTLTGLPNRVLFMDRLAAAVERAKHHSDLLSAVLFLDLDRFKLINDSVGHILGDQMLVTSAWRVEASVRPGDTVARLGGDEFAVLVEGIKDVSDTTRIADRIQAALIMPWQIDGREMSTSASIGIALTSGGYDRPEDLLRDADTAMYRAKALGKARYEIFATDMHRNVVEQVQMEADLRMALVRGEFRVYYQPFVSLTTGRITGAEALVRWQHPLRGVVPPGDFITLAEETGLIAPIDEWVLQTACRQAQMWRLAGFPHLRIAVNTSARQLENPQLTQIVFRILNETGLAPTALELEITETVAMKDMDLSAKILHELAEMGVSISIDDFGNSYSSLGYLKHFPLATLKIDRSFIQDIPGDPDDTAIVNAIIALAHSLKLRVVAEGVETESQQSTLRTLSCDEMQGYLFSLPVTAAEFPELLQATNAPGQVLI